MVTPQPALAQMQGQTRVAVRTLADPAAGMTGEYGRIAPSVEKEQDLVARRELGVHVRAQHRRESGAQWLITDIEDRDRRRTRTARALSQTQPTVASELGIAQCLQRGRGRTQHHRTASELGTAYRQIASRVAQSILLLE
jgi:hypothetical protein